MKGIPLILWDIITFHLLEAKRDLQHIQNFRNIIPSKPDKYKSRSHYVLSKR
ncbi:hypothetical protein CA2015_2114 [Cyclobacterium amurskyense]|uniref:Uncharacterized protein n=1 Tax=Cyclobacterium amurskyense TaxID=320787 RepID=A0A0H4PAS6_9BACT|nr:hypothetical protein CA2015_2114 [Cyclobacterium amurskyense]